MKNQFLIFFKQISEFKHFDMFEKENTKKKKKTETDNFFLSQFLKLKSLNKLIRGHVCLFLFVFLANAKK